MTNGIEGKKMKAEENQGIQILHRNENPTDIREIKCYLRLAQMIFGSLPTPTRTHELD